MSKLSLDLSRDICSTIVSKCKEKGFAPIACAVIDANANIIVQMRMDGCLPVAYPKLALAKATTCVSFGVSSRRFRDKYPATDATKIAQLANMVSCMDGRVAAFPGGVLLLPAGGGNEIVGAVGVSGASSDQDEWLALTSIRECGFSGRTDPETSPLEI